MRATGILGFLLVLLLPASVAADESEPPGEGASGSSPPDESARSPPGDAPAEADASADADAAHANETAESLADAQAGVEAETDVSEATENEAVQEGAQATDDAVEEVAEDLDMTSPAPSVAQTLRDASHTRATVHVRVGLSREGRLVLDTSLSLNEASQSAGFEAAPPPFAVPTLPLLDSPPPEEAPAPFASAPEHPAAPDNPDEVDVQGALYPTTPGPSLGVVVAGTVLVGATASMGAVLAPGWRTVASRVLRATGITALFSRLTGAEVLGHERRNEIYECVKQNPGERLEFVRKRLGIPNGAMLHHLRVLDAHNLVRVHHVDGMSRLYPAGPRVEPTPYLPPLRRRFIQQLQVSPGITQRDIARDLGLSERVVSYHMGWLSRQGLVRVERSGVAKRCFAAPNAATMNGPAAPVPA